MYRIKRKAVTNSSGKSGYTYIVEELKTVFVFFKVWLPITVDGRVAIDFDSIENAEESIEVLKGNNDIVKTYA